MKDNRTMEEKVGLELVYDDRNDILEVNDYYTGVNIMVVERAVAEHNCPVDPEEDNTEEILCWFLDNFDVQDRKLVI